ncbi:PAS domain-containing sensor histidine kinase [Alteromonas sp. KUL49]|uniref:PAS domain-containing sensor histidine kinase n=1 Tax=Alteromonas sp. KUL49 TaxID=2480798 RepID=UPI00102F0954|nr:PAS domain-containing sensor histidine kinase [Alteromonas sp. KUL49]TAP38828.1 PAS domain-containing sensor histidine kinase [Alteromonas sp. KUL49]GEA12258.1 hypothetical protein KUL49_26330 [Alteromonas sp. KUL49]
MSAQSELQLNIIRGLLDTKVTDETQGNLFTETLGALSELLSTRLIIFSEVYKDSQNNRYKFSHHLVASNSHGKNAGKFEFELAENERPTLFQALYEKRSELLVTGESLRDNLLSVESWVSKFNFSDQHFSVVPFFNKNDLCGLVICKVKEATAMDTMFPAVHQCLSSHFVNRSVYLKQKLDINTYQTVLDLMPQRVFWKNRQSVYVGCNKAFSDDASKNCPADLVGLTDFDVFPEQAELYRGDDANTMSTREHMICSEEPQTHQNGNTIWLRTSKRPIIDDNDDVVGVVGTYDDITLLKDVQSQLQALNESLESLVEERTEALTQSNCKLEETLSALKSTQEQLIESEKMAALGNLVAGVAHEINTPLGVALTCASHLEHISGSLQSSAKTGSLSKSKFDEYCHDITNGCDLLLTNLHRAAELVENFKQIAVDQTHNEQRSINVKSYLKEILSAMSPKVEKKNIRMFVSGKDNVVVKTLPGAVSQIVTNLIDNAFTHGFREVFNGEIRIHFKQVEARLLITFQDNGCGIDSNALKRIFEPFYTTSREHGGTGLGLSVVYNLVTQSLKGEITATSRLDEWTKFELSFPIGTE